MVNVEYCSLFVDPSPASQAKCIVLEEVRWRINNPDPRFGEAIGENGKACALLEAIAGFSFDEFTVPLRGFAVTNEEGGPPITSTPGCTAMFTTSWRLAPH